MVTSARKLGEPIRAAIPLHPPYHPSEPRAPCPIGKEYLRSSLYSSALTSGEHLGRSVVSGEVLSLARRLLLLLAIEPRALYMLSTHGPTDLYPESQSPST